MLKGLCAACLQPFRDGDECKEVGNNTIVMVLGKKSGQMVPVPLNDPRSSVIVHRHCTVHYEDPRSNKEFMAAVEETLRPQWEEQWEEENLDRITAEAYERADDQLKRVCAGCHEEIERMDADDEPPQPLTPLPWGVTS